MDYSTLNLTRLRKLPTYNLPHNHHLQESSGNGCAGDPPGFPTYFTRSVYTKQGSTPRNGPDVVIVLDGVNYVVDDGKWAAGDDWDKRLARHNSLMRRLWVPLPIDHERTRLWIVGTYQHHHHCYNGHGDDMVIYPVLYYKRKEYRHDPKWRDEYITAHKAEVDAFNAQLEDQHRALAVPDNHNAVRIIRKFYPDYQPELDLISDPPKQRVGQWWETEAVQPSEEECARSQRWGKSHPFNKTWCQWCGRTYPAAV